MATATRWVAVDRLRELFTYDSVAGTFTSNASGKAVGFFNARGYVRLYVKGTLHYAHRIAWAMHYGTWPDVKAGIDHIDGNKANNAISNLRVATASQNLHNVRRGAANTSGVKGVYWWPQRKKWRVRLTVRGKIHSLGLFACIGVAAKTHREAALRLQGDFAPKSSIVF